MAQLSEQFARRAILVSMGILILLVIAAAYIQGFQYKTEAVEDPIGYLLYPIFFFYDFPVLVAPIFFMAAVWPIFFFKGSRQTTRIAIALPWLSFIPTLVVLIAEMGFGFFLTIIIGLGAPIILPINGFTMYLQRLFVAGKRANFVWVLGIFVAVLILYAWGGMNWYFGGY